MTPTPAPVDITQFIRIAEQAELHHRVGDCAHPVRLTGTRLHVEPGTGRVVDRLDTTDLPGGVLHVRCGNRRAHACLPCSTLYKYDAFNVIAAGLRGGKDVPDTVAGRPRLFVTLTAPSFGKVHLGPDKHGLPRACGCGQWHQPGEPDIGSPVDADGYDYPGQVLFNAHAAALWARFTLETRRALAAADGLRVRELRDVARIVFAKVAEYQARGVVHFHAVVRLDGPDGPATAPPASMNTVRLSHAIRRAAGKAAVSTPDSNVLAARQLSWGRQIDVRPIEAGDGDLPDIAVARYVAKYATKSTEAAGLELGPIHCHGCAGGGSTGIGDRHLEKSRLCRTCHGTGRRASVDLSGLPEHARRLVDTCWRLGGRPEFAGLKLRRWAHMLGYRGHFTTKSRTYSTTFGDLRAERQAWTEQHRADGTTSHGGLLVVDDWHYAGRGVLGGDADA
jgi:hypothetical protein